MSTVYGILRVGETLLGVQIESLSEVCAIEELQPILYESDWFMGGLNLRDQLIPVIDMKRLCKVETDSELPEFAAVLRHDQKLVAIGVDEIIGLARAPGDEVQPLLGLPEMAAKIIGGTFLYEKRVVTVVEVTSLFQTSDVPVIPMRQNGDSLVKDHTKTSMLTFDIGGALISMPAIEIYGSVPRQKIQSNSITHGQCLGSITHHGRRIPVINSSSFFGLGSGAQLLEAEVVVMRFPDDRLLGFAVQAICDIQFVDSADMKPISPSIRKHSKYISTFRFSSEREQIYIPDVEKLKSEANLIELASLSSDLELPAQESVSTTAQYEEIDFSEKSYLIFETSSLYAALLTDVIRILRFPEKVVPVSQACQGILGYFSFDDFSVPLVNLVPEGAEPADAERSRVLLIGDGVNYCGFCVSAVNAIARSEWCAQALRNRGGESDCIVKFKDSDIGTIVKTLDLKGMCQEILVLPT